MKREERVKKFATAVQRDIISCPNEQAYDEGDVIWIFGSCTDLSDLLTNHEVPEDLEEEVVAKLHCPKCSSPLEIWQEVGAKPDFEQSHEATIEQAMLKNGKHMFAFSRFLLEFPMLGATHPFGKRFLRELRKSPKTALNQHSWFRARVCKEHGFGLTPAELVSDQRYNSSGQSRWYFSDNPKTAVAEVSPEGTAWVQCYDVGHLDKLLDLRSLRPSDDRVLDAEGDYHPPHDFLVVSMIFGDLLTQRNPNDDGARKWKPEYLLSRFVAEAAKSVGFTGILCGSVRHAGENLVVFDSNWSPKSRESLS